LVAVMRKRHVNWETAKLQNGLNPKDTAVDLMGDSKLITNGNSQI